MCNPVTTLNPDCLLAKGTANGYEWEVVSNPLGYRCGYVRIPAGHPWHGKGIDDVNPDPFVHGGLNFARADTDCGKGGGDDAWWLGFDCAHAGDAPDPALPGHDPHMLELLQRAGWTVRSTDYVIGECVSLARQAAAAVR